MPGICRALHLTQPRHKGHFTSTTPTKKGHNILVGGFDNLEKYWSVGMTIPYIMKKMFQNTNQNTIMYYNYWTYVHQLSYPFRGPRIGGIIHQRPAFFQRAALLADPLP
jgi:hypothetical protein